MNSLTRFLILFWCLLIVGCAAMRQTEEEKIQAMLRQSGSYHVQQGVVATDSALYNKALDHYRRAMELIPYEPILYNNMGVTFLKMGRIDSALYYFQVALRKQPRYSRALVNMANAYLEANQPQYALAAVDRALEIKSGFTDALVAKALIYDRLGQMDSALAMYEKVVSIDSLNADYYINMGALLFQKGMVRDAVEQYSRAVEINPDRAVAHYNWGNALAHLCKLEEALMQYDKAIQLDNTFIGAYNNRGLVFMSLGEYHTALSDFWQAREINAREPSIHFNLSIIYERSGDLDSALVYVDRAVALDSTMPLFQIQRGNILLEAHQIAKAIQAYEKAIQMDSSLAVGYNNLGNAYLEKQDANLAKEAFEKTMSLYPEYLESRYFDQTRRLEEGVYDLLGHCRSVGDIRSGYARLYSNLGAAHLRLRNFAAAKQAFERAVEIEPTLIEPYEQLAFLYQKQGEQAAAYRALSRARYWMAERALDVDSLDIAQANNQEALDFNVTDAAAHAQRAEIIIKQGDNPEDAKSWLEQAGALDAKNPRVWMVWGRYYLAQNDWVSAQKAFHNVMELDPDSKRGLENLITALTSAGFEDQVDVYKAKKYYLEGTEFQFAGYWDQALTAYEHAVRLDSLQPDYWAAQGYVWAKKHIHEKAQSMFDRALSLDADNAMAWYGRGVVAGDQGRYQEAIDALKRALKTESDPGKVHYALAVNYYFQNRIDMAWKHLQLALQLGVSVNPSFLNEMKNAHAEHVFQ